LSMATMLRGLIAASIIFLLSECKDSEQPKKDFICSWQGSAPFCVRDPCAKDHTFIADSDDASSPFAGSSGSHCVTGLKRLCCKTAHVKKDIKENCRYRDSCEGYQYVFKAGGSVPFCCTSGTLVW
ncbi:hypothetical protein PENTCL1PPCAC_14901, partial [Pristionchus entomophagus]